MSVFHPPAGVDMNTDPILRELPHHILCGHMPASMYQVFLSVIGAVDFKIIGYAKSPKQNQTKTRE